MSPRCGRGMPLAMCTSPSTPNSSAAQPMTCRPAGPLLSGLRRLRQATKHSSSGTNQPSRPTEPFTTVRVKSPTPPGSCHQTAAATTTARPIRNSPAPSRRCSGSRSRAVCPILRTAAPSTWATPSHTAASPRPRASPSAAMGPVPLRTARGAGTARLLRRATLRCGLPAGLAAGRPGRGSGRLRAGLGGRLGGALVPRRRWGRRTGRHGAEDTQKSHQSLASHARRPVRTAIFRGLVLHGLPAPAKCRL